MIPLFAWADRSVGGAGHRSYVFGTIIIIGVWLSVYYPAAGVACIAWCVYRSLAWWGTTTPRSVREILLSYAHNLIPFVAMALLWKNGMASGKQVSFMFSYAVWATILAALYGVIVDWMAAHGRSEDGQVNRWIEILRGAYFGFCLMFPYLTAK